MSHLSRFVSALFLATTFGFAISAHALDVPFSFTGTGYSGSGTLFTTANGDGTYTITGITGISDGSTIAGLAPTDNNDGADYLYSPTEPHLDFSGFSYVTDAGQYLNIYLENNTPQYGLEDFTVVRLDPNISDPFVVGSTPEPSSLILLGTGLISVAGAARRRFQRA